MDDMRNRGYAAFPRMPHWIGEDDPQMADLASRMGHVPGWPMSSMGRRGGPWRDRRNSGGSAMSATSEDDSSYDHPHNDKSSQGSGGSGGLDAGVGHEIPIMIEAEAPPSMMPPQQQQPQPVGAMCGPEPPLVGQVRKSPQYATRTASANDEGNAALQRDQQRATRCSSAPPSMIDQPANGRPQATGGSGAPQTRSATVPINPNNVPKPFVPTYKSSNSPRAQDPIMEENLQQARKSGSRHSSPAPQIHHTQQPHPNQAYQQKQHPENQQQQPPQNYQQQQQQQLQQDPNYQQQHPQQQYYEQEPQYYGHQQWPNQGFFQQYPDYEQPWSQFYANDPRMYEQEQHYAQQPQQQQQPQHQKPSVVRTIPIFVEGQDRPIVNEEKASSLSSSPRTAPQMSRSQQQPRQQPQQQPRQQPQQQQPRQQQVPPDQFWNHPQQFFRNNQPFRSQDMQQPYYPEQQYYQQQQPQQQYHQQQKPQQQQQQQPPQQHRQQPQPQDSQEIPVTTQMEPSPPFVPPPPPVKLTPLEKIEQVRSKNEEFMRKVDEFTGTRADREFLYLDEMLTRALISLDDIDPDGNAEIRQARKNLIKDINSKISLLEKKASAASGNAKTKEKSPAPAGEPSESSKADSAVDSAAAPNLAPAEAKEPSPAPNAGCNNSAASSDAAAEKPKNNGAAAVPPHPFEENKSSEEKKTTADATASVGGEANNNNNADPSKRADEGRENGPGENPGASDKKGEVIKEPIPCPAPPIPLPEK